MSILQTISGHEDLVRLDDSQRALLCEELREVLVSGVARTGGHLASNLGTVELCVAIETVYNTMEDRLVFDVGHQSYVHKLLTGRQAEFSSLRQFGGISGFPKPAESGTDAFVAGHASSSVSIALGMARARTLRKEHYHVVALLGDGAFTGGMAYEGLNDAAVSREPLVIILNDNEMSINRNVGGVSRHLSMLRTKERYLGMKKKYRAMLRGIPGGQTIYRLTKNFKNRLKRMLLPTTIFENMGMNYLGPVDGHDLPGLISLLKSAKDLGEPVLVHVLTRKGRGYAPAEEDPAKFHGIGRFDPASGQSMTEGGTNFSRVFGETMVALAAENPRLCAITAAMPGGTGLVPFQKQYPKRIFDVGIAEEHAVSMAGGLAKQGLVPVVAIYSTFLQRAYDQILQDVALLGLHVVFAIDRAGLVGEDGPTHHGVYDVGFLRQIPGMTVLCPASFQELREMLRWAVMDCTGPVAVRYPRGGETPELSCGFSGNPEEVVTRFSAGDKATLLCYGSTVGLCLEAARILRDSGIGVNVVSVCSVTHFSREALTRCASGKALFVVEEVMSGTGISETVAMEFQRRENSPRVYPMDVGREFVPHGDMCSLYRLVGLDGESIARRVREVIEHEE